MLHCDNSDLDTGIQVCPPKKQDYEKLCCRPYKAGSYQTYYIVEASNSKLLPVHSRPNKLAAPGVSVLNTWHAFIWIVIAPAPYLFRRSISFEYLGLPFESKLYPAFSTKSTFSWSSWFSKWLDHSDLITVGRTVPAAEFENLNLWKSRHADWVTPTQHRHHQKYTSNTPTELHN
jgi:hypothetical protein